MPEPADADAPLAPPVGAGRDRAWWEEPDPVELFASSVELALRQLRVEVAGLRAERDGLKLEVEGLRAKLLIAEEQRVARDGLADTVRQLQLAVARLTSTEAARTAPPATAPDASVPGEGATGGPIAVDAPAPAPVSDAARPGTPIVLEAPASRLIEQVPVEEEPIEPEPIVDEVILVEPIEVDLDPRPLGRTAIDDVGDIEAELTELVEPRHERSRSSEPSALEQLARMGVWPPRDGGPSTTGPPQPVMPTETPLVGDDWDPDADALVGTWHGEDRRPRVAVEPAPTVRPGWQEEFERARESYAAQYVDDRPSRARIWATRLAMLIAAVVVLVILLVSVGPRILPYQTYFVRSGSMSPTIDTGDLVVLTRVDAAQLEVGDIITFEQPDESGTLVTHRIVGVESTGDGRAFVTKGDANAVEDPWRVPATGDGWRYAFSVGTLGYVFDVLATPAARILLLGVPAVVLLVLEVARRRPRRR